jgi:4a-hydroxytetrahydrobiopterin dehydratase
MKPLSEYPCAATPRDAAKLSNNEQRELAKQIAEWNIDLNDGVAQLWRVYRVGNFIQAMAFANEISLIAEEGDHHPALLVEWGRIKVSWWSHSIGGLHLNDFVMAAKTDEIFKVL